jgi:uncharacterized protein with HEPN domain
MPDRDRRFRLDDMLVAIERIESYVAGLDNAAFFADQKTIDAAVRNFEIIGEAANQLSDDFRLSHPDVPWSQVRGMRNRLIHDYAMVDVEILWQTIQHDLPSLKAALQRILER